MKNKPVNMGMVELNPDQMAKMMTLMDNPEKLIDFLSGIQKEQTAPKEDLYSMVRMMMGEDNPCDCDECKAAKDRVAKEEANLKKLMETYGKSDAKGFDMAQAFADFNQTMPMPPEEEEPLPQWAVSRAHGRYIQKMTQLVTRDGRRTGNATIFDIVYDAKYNQTQFWVITDARNVMKLSFNEMVELFHEPKYILMDFPNNQDDQVGEFLNEWYSENIGPFRGHDFE